MLSTDPISLAEIAPYLMATYGMSPTYDRIYKAVLSGRIRTTRQGRAYYVARSEISVIAQLFRIDTTKNCVVRAISDPEKIQ